MSPSPRARRPEPNVGSRPTWPAGKCLREWLECTAAWAAEIPPCAAERHFGHFALRELCARGHLDAAGRAVDALMRLRCTDDILRRFSEDEELLSALLVLERHDDARSLLHTLLDLSIAVARKSDRAYGIKKMFELLCARGVEAGVPEDFRMEKQRVAHLRDILSATTLPLVRPAEPPYAATKRSASELEAEARQELSELGPDTMNVHLAVSKIPWATKALAQEGRHEEARVLIADATARLDAGDLDSYGVASAGAYLRLARAAGNIGDRDRAEALVERAWAVATPKGATIVRPDAAIVYAEIGATSKAITQARKTRDSRLIAEILLWTHEDAELALHLRKISDPVDAARLAWGIARTLINGTL